MKIIKNSNSFAIEPGDIFSSPQGLGTYVILVDNKEGGTKYRLCSLDGRYISMDRPSDSPKQAFEDCFGEDKQVKILIKYKDVRICSAKDLER